MPCTCSAHLHRMAVTGFLQGKGVLWIKCTINILLMKRNKPTYSARNILLGLLGYRDYRDYLASELWSEIRSAVLDRDDYSCRLCGEPTRIVHHIQYDVDTLLGDKFDNLVSLCDGCHTKVEFTSKGKKRTLVEAVAMYRCLCYYSKKPKKQRRGRRK